MLTHLDASFKVEDGLKKERLRLLNEVAVDIVASFDQWVPENMVQVRGKADR